LPQTSKAFHPFLYAPLSSEALTLPIFEQHGVRLRPTIQTGVFIFTLKASLPLTEKKWETAHLAMLVLQVTLVWQKPHNLTWANWYLESRSEYGLLPGKRFTGKSDSCFCYAFGCFSDGPAPQKASIPYVTQPHEDVISPSFREGARAGDPLFKSGSPRIFLSRPYPV
jgi:hypothetical protein